jgi:nucleoside-diphosphate-sugar epimerase
MLMIVLVWTSVTTLAQAHTLALTVQKAGNERFLVLNGDFDNQELADVIHAQDSIPAIAKTRVPVGQKGERLRGKVFSADCSKVVDFLGLDFKAKGESLEETVAGLVQQLLVLEGKTKL